MPVDRRFTERNEMDEVNDDPGIGNASSSSSGTAAVSPAYPDPDPVAGPSGLKRPAVDDGDGGGNSSKKLKGLWGVDDVGGQDAAKNAVMRLNESVPGLHYVVASASGPAHSPTFTVTVNYAKQVFSGCGATKKQAKMNAAETVWRFVQRQRSSSSSPSSSSSSSSGAGSSQSSSSATAGALSGVSSAPGTTTTLAAGTGTRTGTGTGTGTETGLMLRNPLSLLNEIWPGIKYEVVSETGQSHCRAYSIAVVVEGREFIGTASNKRLAKTRAAQAAMETVYGCTFPPDPGALEPMESTSDQTAQQQQQQQQQHGTLADVISAMVLSKFSELSNQHTALNRRYKVIAGVVMTTDDADPSAGARLVSMATGSKCVAGESVSAVGKTIADLHAENLAVRGCRLFILKEMQRLQEFLKTGGGDDPSDIIVQRDQTGGDDDEEHLFAVKPSVKFHLFVSAAPCGHARLPPSSREDHRPDDSSRRPGDRGTDAGEEDEGSGGTQRPSRPRGAIAGARLRAKMESGEGTVPVGTAGHVQTLDGIVNGEKLMAMSCTDRITRWNVLGIQGSLLSHLLKPVYLDSIVIGRIYNNDHLKHALYGRIGHLANLPPDYRVNRPLISPITHPDARSTVKAPDYSCHWMDDGAPMEVIGTASGKLVTCGEASKISRGEFYRAFVHLTDCFGCEFWRRRNVSVDRMTYGEVKAAARTHREVKVALYEALKAAGLGTWVQCPREQQEFTIADC